MVTLESFDLFFLILVRISAFIYTAPFFSIRSIPVRVKAGLSVFLTIIILSTKPYDMPQYASVIEFTIFVVSEAIAGAIMGLFSNIAYHILAFAGRIIDMEIGFSMVNQFDPVANVQTSITANLYGYLVMLMMMATNLHHYFILGIVDSFEIINIGKVTINPNIYQLGVKFITDYFIIGFRIALPVFASILVVNMVLGILTKIAPQMNMFVVGLQLKVFVGLIVLAMIIGMIPAVSDFIFNEMIEMFRSVIRYLF